MKVFIIENSWIAKLAAKRLKTKTVAIVIGKTIYLHNTSKEKFLQNIYWVRHEVEHIFQFKKHGFIEFIFLYLIEHYKCGYTKNKFEIEAKEKEKNIFELNEIEFL
ncbi:MAG: DUF4157 domain-containing protein [Chitinophagaceae bacterium]